MNKNLAVIGVCGYFAPKNKKSSSGGAATAAVNMELLEAIVNATNNNSFVHVAQAHYAPMVAAGLVEVNTAPNMTNSQGEHATRATAEGAATLAAHKAAQSGQGGANPSTGPAGEAKPTFNVVGGIEMPKSKRGGGKTGALYPFETLEVGQSFFVPATAERPNPAKSLASTVSSATQRYAEEDGTKEVQEKDAEGNKLFLDAAKTQPKMVTVPKYKKTREFVARAVEDGAPWGEQFKGVKGAGVWRSA